MRKCVGVVLIVWVLCGGALKLPVWAQSPITDGPYTLHGLPWSISGIDRAPDGTLYLVSDVDNALYAYTPRFTPGHNRNVPELVPKGTPVPLPVTYPGGEEHSGLESVRYINDSTFLFAVEYDKPDGTSASALYLGKRVHNKFELTAIVPERCFPGTWTDNSGIEGVSLTYDRRGIWIVNERPFKEDLSNSHRVVRLTHIDFRGKVIEQIQYALQPDTSFAEPMARTDNGVSEIFVYDADHILILERAFGGVETCRTYGRVFNLDLRRARIQQDCEHAASGAVEPAVELVFDAGQQCPGAHIDNYEGMTWGPVKDGRQTIMLMSDNNGNWKKQTCPQTTDLILFSIDIPLSRD